MMPVFWPDEVEETASLKVGCLVGYSCKSMQALKLKTTVKFEITKDSLM